MSKKVTFYGLKCIDNMLRYVFSYCTDNTIFFAHNLTFDGLIILNFLSSKISIKESGTLLKNCDIYALTLTDGSKNICFRCSAKILPLPLKDIADKLQIPQKLEIDHNSINLENYNNTDVRERVIEYCRRDVQITQNFMFKINEEINSFYPGW